MWSTLALASSTLSLASGNGAVFVLEGVSSAIKFDAEESSELLVTASTITNLQGSSSTLQTKVASLETSSSAQQTKVSALETKVSALETGSSAQQTKVSALETKVSTLETGSSAQQTKVSALETKVASLETSNSALQTKVSGLESALSALTSRLDALEAKPIAANVQSCGASTLNQVYYDSSSKYVTYCIQEADGSYKTVESNAGPAVGTKTTPGTSCKELFDLGVKQDGAYYLKLDDKLVHVHCDMTTESGGWLDLVKSFHLEGQDLTTLMNLFFIKNSDIPSWSPAIGKATGTNTDVFWIQFNAAGGSHEAGTHLKSAMPYSRVRMHWWMQGSDDGYRCSSGNWIPMNGPGYDGGSGGYQTSCPSGWSCIQGRTTDGIDAPIQANYNSDNIDYTKTLLTWSNSNTNHLTGNCARQPLIPVPNVATMYDKLLLK